jgi:hypothetical protein
MRVHPAGYLFLIIIPNTLIVHSEAVMNEAAPQAQSLGRLILLPQKIIMFLGASADE